VKTTSKMTLIMLCGALNSTPTQDMELFSPPVYEYDMKLTIQTITFDRYDVAVGTAHIRLTSICSRYETE